jgi:hypothetical protein
MAEIRRYNDIMRQAVANMAAKQNKITDFNEGSVIFTYLDALSRISERLYSSIRQGYNDNLRLVPYALFGFGRKDGRKATGTVKFIRTAPLQSQTVVTGGTRVSGGGKIYETTEDAYIAAGAIESNGVAVLALEAGSGSNAAEYTVDRVDTATPTDVAGVVNEGKILGGTDAETDEEFDERFRIFINGLSGTNEFAIRSAALGLDSVRSVSTKIHKPPLNNIYNMSIYVDDGTGSATQQTLDEVMLAIEGNGTSLNPGHLAPGINVRVLSPATVYMGFSIRAYVYHMDAEVAEADIAGTVQEYVNGLTIGRHVILSEIVKRIMKLAYIRDVAILSPTENIIIGTDQIARYSSADIDIRQAEEIGDG